MFHTKLSTRIIALSAGLAAVSAVLQLIHIGYRSPAFGMWIDLVAVTWIVAYFLFGVRSAILVSFMGALIITLFAPDTWLGASMKWLATMPIWLCLYLWVRMLHKNPSYYKKFSHLLIPLAIGLIVRSIIIIPVNYFYAIPIWTGMTAAKAMTVIPWYVIAGFNTVQGILDVLLAWILVYRFQLSRFSQKSEEL